MMRMGTSGGRRAFLVVALLVVLAVGVPELAAPAGAAVAARSQRHEIVSRPATRKTLTAAQKKKLQNYIRAHPEVLTKNKNKQAKPATKAKKRRGKRKVSRKARAAHRKRAAKKRKAKARTAARKRKARRGAAARKRRAKAGKSKKHKKKGATSATTKMIHWIALLFLIGLPFIAVGLLLFGTDYRRRPRSVSNKKRRRVLVITPVGRKY
jgi:cobalamin biosynthesis Mg chelatase CobN